MNREEAAYLQAFSGWLPTDDSCWDLWLVMWSSDFCAGEYRSLEAAQAAWDRMQKRTETMLRIEQIPNAGYGDMRLVGRWRYFAPFLSKE